MTLKIFVSEITGQMIIGDIIDILTRILDSIFGVFVKAV
jgi:hypothetical protein